VALTLALLAAAYLTLWTNDPVREAASGVQQRQLAYSAEERELITKLVFAECVGMHFNQCKNVIDAAHAANPAAFDNVPYVTYHTVKARDQTTLDHAALEADPDMLLTIDNGDYMLVGLRTDLNETYIVGIEGDGIVTYPYKWCLDYGNWVPIGPWDCSGMLYDECCDSIKADVPEPDVHGNYIDCYESFPRGSRNNPLDYGRVVMHISQINKVVHPPING